MREKKPSERDLHEAFGAVTEALEQGIQCPETGKIWESAALELPPAEDRELILHLSTCGDCATAWRLARETLPDRVESGALDRKTSFFTRYRIHLAAAAVIVVAAGLGFMFLPDRPGSVPVYREQENVWLKPAFDHGVSIARDDCLLSWTAGPEGTTYDLRVTDQDLEPLVRAIRIGEPRYLVEAGVLDAVPPGGSIQWRVVAHLPDGREVMSRTFVTSLE